MKERLVDLISRVARKSGFRDLVRGSRRVDDAWKQLRQLILSTPADAAPPATLSRFETMVPHRFRALLAQRFETSDVDAERDPLKRMYLDFALSTVWRAGKIREFVEQRTDIVGKRYLDVGCAYGGFLATFHDAGAAQVVGFDFDAALLDYAHALLEDYSIPATIEHDSILSPSIVARFGRFDIVTCNDVLEHVTDARVALTNLAALLAPGGFLCLEIPNRYAASFVLSDGHFQKFGLTSLPKRLADARFAAEEGRAHDVTYKSFDWYVNALTRCGLEVSIENPHLVDSTAYFANVAATFAEVERKADDFESSNEYREVSARYARRAARQFRHLHANLKQNRPQAASARRLQLTFGEEFWRVTARAPK